jgi:hypothetical protein
MKKTLLSLGLASLIFGASAQINETGDAFFLDINPETNCLVGIAGVPTGGGAAKTSNNGIISNGPTLTSADVSGGASGSTANDYVSVDQEFRVYSTADVSGGGAANWFDLPVVDGTNCSNYRSKDLGVDLSSAGSGKVSITVKSDIDATLELFIGYAVGFNITSSTYVTNGGKSIIAVIESTTEEKTYTIDLENIAGDGDWEGWTDKDKVNCYGLRSKTNDAVFEISDITIGDLTASLSENASSAGFKAFPNPASNVVNFTYEVSGNTSIDLANALGSTVAATEGTSMNVEELPAGIYFATLKVNGVATAVQRIQVK